MKTLEKLKDIDGFIDISDLKSNKMSVFRNVYTLDFNNKKYYFKTIYSIDTIYNELIAEEIAKDYNIPHIHYELAVLDGNIGVISENFVKDNEEYINMDNLLKKVYSNSKDKTNHNNLTDIWDALDITFKNNELVENLMNQIVNIFLFDILIANNDRHDENYGIIVGNNIKISPVFDNNCMLSDISLYEGEYSITIDQDSNEENNIIQEFLSVSSLEYTELLKSKLWIIEENNINKVLERVEKRINRKIEERYKTSIKRKFSLQLKNIKKELNTHIKKSYTK